jgi:hypothetical protein
MSNQVRQTQHKLSLIYKYHNKFRNSFLYILQQSDINLKSLKIDSMSFLPNYM